MTGPEGKGRGIDGLFSESFSNSKILFCCLALSKIVLLQ